MEKWLTHIIKQQIKMTFFLLCSPNSVQFALIGLRFTITIYRFCSTAALELFPPLKSQVPSHLSNSG